MVFLRIYLAICVIAQHSEKIFPWIAHTGREAVQIFFMISGFYMCMILSQDRYKKLSAFYSSRALKIFTPYFVILAFVILLSIASSYLFNDSLTLSKFPELNSLSAPGQAFVVSTNFSLLFQDFKLFLWDNGQCLQFTPDFRANANPLRDYFLIPQAWSISLEIMFYLIVPFLVHKCNTKILVSLALVMFFLRVIFYVKTGYINDPWTYRFFPFELTHFIYGMLAYQFMVRFSRHFIWIGDQIGRLLKKCGRAEMVAFYTVLMFFLWMHKFTLEQMKIMLSGIASGGVIHLAALTTWILIIPLIFTVTKRMRFDRELGELSYPVYLIHYSIILLIMAITKEDHHLAYLGELATVISLIIAVLFNKFIFSSFESWRQKFILRSA